MRPPKARCDGSSPSPDANFAGQHKIACGVLGKDDGKAQILRLAPDVETHGTTAEMINSRESRPIAPQALLAMRRACTSEITGSIPVLGSNMPE